jgi:hypothetical protein
MAAPARAVNVRLCDRAGCNEPGNCPAPKSPNSPDRWYFCEKHAAEYNAGWDYFAGLDKEEAAAREQAERRTNEGYRDASWKAWAGPGDGTRSRDELRALEALGLDPDAAFEDVRKAWRTRAKEVHPDVRPGDEQAAAEFQKLQLAYEVLRAAGSGGRGRARPDRDTSGEEAKAVAKVRFDWEDALGLDSQLTGERMIRDAARAFAQDRLQSRVIAAFADETTDPEIFAEMGAQGLLGVTLPERFGGADASYVGYGLVAREVERVDSGYRSMMSVQSSLVMHPIHAYGSDAQRERYLPGWRGAGDRLLRPDRARCRIGPGRHAHPRREDRRRLSPQRHQDLDFQRADCRCLRDLGQE